MFNFETLWGPSIGSGLTICTKSTLYENALIIISQIEALYFLRRNGNLGSTLSKDASIVISTI